MKRVVLIAAGAVLLAGCASSDNRTSLGGVEAVPSEEIPLPTTVAAVGEAPYSEATRALMSGAGTEAKAAYGVRETVPVPSLNLYPYALRVGEITSFYAVGDDSTLNSRLKKRNEEIRRLFLRFYNDRGAELRRHQIYQVQETRCKNSRRGTRKLCAGEMSWSVDYEVIPVSVADSRSSFHEHARITGPNKIEWVMRKTGKGTNHGSVEGTARFTSAKIELEIEAGKVALRRELQARGLPTDQAIDP